MRKVDLEKLEKRVRSLPSVQNGALMDIIRRMYQEKPLLGEK